MSEEELFAFLVVEYNYDSGNDVIVVVANDEDEARKIALKNYGMLEVDAVRKIVAETKGYYEEGYFGKQDIEFNCV